MSEPPGRVESIQIAPDTGEDMEMVDEVEAVAGKGLAGDRYFKGKGIWNEMEDQEHTEASQVTLFELETLEAIERDYDISLNLSDHRRNITVSNVALNHLVDRKFVVGEAVFEGIGLCEPCGYLQAMVGENNLAESLKHRGGLDANIVESGWVKRGDPIRIDT